MLVTHKLQAYKDDCKLTNIQVIFIDFVTILKYANKIFNINSINSYNITATL